MSQLDIKTIPIIFSDNGARQVLVLYSATPIKNILSITRFVGSKLYNYLMKPDMSEYETARFNEQQAKGKRGKEGKGEKRTVL